MIITEKVGFGIDMSSKADRETHHINMCQSQQPNAMVSLVAIKQDEISH